MLRRLITFLSALSLLLCVATVVLWPVSFAGPVVLERMTATGHLYAAAGRGGLYLGRYTGLERADAGLRAGRWADDKVDGHEVTFRAYSWTYGFGERRGGSALTRGGGFGYTVVRVPLWFAAPVFGVLPAVHGARAALAYKRRRRGRLGLCPTCGYDLRATPGRCPECGTKAGLVSNAG